MTVSFWISTPSFASTACKRLAHQNSKLRILLASSTLNRCAVELRTHDCASWPESQPVCLQRPCKDPCAIQLEMHW